jgi:DNA-binding transcriptional LysR family regulator
MEERLYKFARLVDAGSFTKAAQVMHISQPALTAAVQKLERELRAELLIRGSREFRLTAAGRVAYETAKQLGIEADNLKVRLAELQNQKVDLRLGMIDSLANLLFVQGDSLQELEANTHLSLTVDNSDRLIKSIAHDDLDVALIAHPSVLPATLLSINLGQEPLVLVTHAQLAKQTQQDLQANTLRHFLSYNQNSHTYQLVQEHFAKQGVVVQPTFYSTSPEIMLELVLHQRGTAALPYLLVKEHIKRGELVALTPNGSTCIARNIVSIHRAGRSLPTEASNLLATIQGQLTRQMAEVSQR